MQETYMRRAIELAKKEFKQYKNKALYEINNATNVYELIEEIKYPAN